MSSENLEQNIQEDLGNSNAGAPSSDDDLSEDYSNLKIQENIHNMKQKKVDYSYSSNFNGSSAPKLEVKPEQVGYENDVFTGKIKIIRTLKGYYDQIKEKGIILTYINNLPGYGY